MRIFWATATAAVLLASAARAAEALEDYGRLPAVEEMTLSPSGDQIATVAVLGESRKVVVMSTAGVARLVAPIGVMKLRSLRWAGEDHLLVGTSQVVNMPMVFAAKYELSTEINIDLKTKEAPVVFSKNREVYPAIFRDYGVRQTDDGLFGFFGAITLERSRTGDVSLTHSIVDLYRVDLEDGAARRIAQGSELEHDWVIGADGSVVARSEYEEKTGRWRLLTGDFGGRQLMVKKAPFDEVDLTGLGRTPDSVLVVDGTGDTIVAEEQPLNGNAPTPLFEDMRPSRYLFSPKSRLLIGAVIEGRDAVLFDAKLQARFKGARKALAGYESHLVSYTDDFGRMIIFTDGGDDSGTYWLVDIKTGDAKPIGSAYPTIHPKDVGPTRLVTYRAADGMALDGVLTLPPGREAKNLPVVVMPHGGPMGIYDQVGFHWWAQAFASRGYAVFQPNYRGSGGHDLALFDAGFGEWGRKMQTDVSDGLAEIARQGLVDSKRACIVGASYGGYAALAGVTMQRDLYRCAVSYGGVSDLGAMLTYDATRNGGRQNRVLRFLRAAIGVKEGGDPLLAKLSPDSWAARADAPILLIHGKDDTVVSPEQTDRMAAALKRAGKPFEVKMLPGEDHYLSREETRIATLEASVAFVEKHNPAN